MKNVLAFAAVIFMVVVVLAIVIPVFGLWSGFVISKLWLWLIVPIFHVQPLSVAQAMALGMVVAYIAKPDLSDLKKKDDYKAWATFVTPFATGGVVLLTAYILRHFI